MLQVNDLHFSHGGREPDVLRGVCLEAREGEITTVLGPNGCGKTTLFKCIGGIWKPQKGEVNLYGEDMLGRRTWSAQSFSPPFPRSTRRPSPIRFSTWC